MNKVYFAENIKQIREKNKLTQAEFAEQLGVNQRTISNWEKGICEPNFTMLLKIREVFDETFENILL